jgi:hypothetical protein
VLIRKSELEGLMQRKIKTAVENRLYSSKNKEKWERLVKNYDEETGRKPRNNKDERQKLHIICE